MDDLRQNSTINLHKNGTAFKLPGSSLFNLVRSMWPQSPYTGHDTPQNRNRKISDLKKRKNFASKDSGATIIASEHVKNPKNILSKSSDDYTILKKCNSEIRPYLIINLSEEVLIDSILTTNQEDFSANLAEIKFFGSDDYPPKNDKWVNLHSIYPLESENIHHLEINTENFKTMFRYLKVVMIGKESN